MHTNKAPAPTADATRGAPTDPDQPTAVPQPAHPGRFQPAAKLVHNVLGWLLATSATLLAASGQVEYAIAADITDLRRFLVPAILEIAAIFLILGGYLRACDGDSPALLWLLASGVTGFATWTNLTHGGPRAGRIFAAATVITFVLWLLKLRDRYRTARRASGLIDAPTAKFRLIRWLVMPRLTSRAWLLAIEYSLRDADEALHRARLWHDTARDAHAATPGKARERRAAAHRAAEHAVRRRAHAAGVTALMTPAAPPPTTEQTAPLLAGRAHEPHPTMNNPATARRQAAHAHTDDEATPRNDVDNASPDHTGQSPIPRGAPDGAGRRLPQPIVDSSDKDHGDLAPTAEPATKSTERPTPPARSAGVPPEGSPQPPRRADADTPYKPTSEEDTVMYQTWRHCVASGQEPTGADLARAAGRPDDSAGTGRRAARRYRDAHTTHQTSTGPVAPTTPRPRTQQRAAATGRAPATRAR